jgi:hypothetical protein
MEPLLCVRRYDFSDARTLGRLFVRGELRAYTCEDMDRGLDATMPIPEAAARKVPGVTAIGVGILPLTWSWSPTKKRWTPRIQRVPVFEGILIHSGNWARDSLGCVLVGEELLADGSGVADSRDACAWLYPLVEDACARAGQVISIERDAEAWAARCSSRPELAWPTRTA